MRRRLYYCDQHPIPLPPGHKFPIAKYALLRERLQGVFALEPAPFAAPETIALVHDREYVDAVLAGTVSPAVMRRIGFPWSPDLVRRTLASVGGTLQAARDAIDTGFGGNLAGGTHHAFRAEGSGFCVFNDLAVAVADLRRSGRMRRAVILDLDVHQGDGTAAIFADDPDVLTISVHSRNNFPFRKQQSRLDVELEDGVDDCGYLRELERVLEAADAFGAELVLYQSGVDGLAEDRLGRLSLTAAGLQARDRAVFAWCRGAGLPVVVTLGGGYADPIERTADAHANTFRLAAEMFGVYY